MKGEAQGEANGDSYAAGAAGHRKHRFSLRPTGNRPRLGPKNKNISSGYHFAPRASAIKGCIHDDQTSDLATPKLRFERENKIEQLGDGSLFDGTR